MVARRLILGTAGHIDHGKTALVRALTGIDTDRLPDEKQRGITIDIGFAHLDFGDVRLGIVDVPGHERFIRNMLAGAAGIDVAMLIVAADDSIMPQTREHLEILKLLDIHHGLIAITKIDRAESSWVDLVEEELRELVQGTFLDRAPIVRTSATTADGVDKLRDTLQQVCEQVIVEPEHRPFRMAIDRSFVLTGLGTVVTGSVSSGSVSVGDSVELLPGQRIVQVRSLESHGETADSVTRGQRAAINLAGVHHTEIERGDELAQKGFLAPSRLLTVDLRILPDAPWPLRHRSRVRLHLGTAEVMASVSLLKSNALAPGERGLAQITCAESIVAACGQAFVIRAESPVLTLGGGAVLQPAPRRIRRSDAATIARLRDLASPDPLSRASAGIHFSRTGRWTHLNLARDAAVPLDAIDTVVETLRSSGQLVERGELALHADTVNTIAAQVERIVGRLHKQSPLDAAVPRTLIARRMRSTDPEVLDVVIAGMLEQGDLVGDDRTVALKSFKPQLNVEQKRLYDDALARMHDAAFATPNSEELAQSLNAPQKQVQMVLDLAQGQGMLVHLGGGVILHRDRERELRENVTRHLSTHPGMTMSELRDLLGTSRKYAVPIGEYLDRIGLTRRIGDKRVLARQPDAASASY